MLLLCGMGGLPEQKSVKLKNVSSWDLLGDSLPLDMNDLNKRLLTEQIKQLRLNSEVDKRHTISMTTNLTPKLFITLLLASISIVLAYDPSKPLQENFLRYQAEQRQQLVYSDQLKAQAIQGDAVAQFDLAMCYAEGRGVEVNRSEAIRWWKKAAVQKVAAAAAYLGDAYRTGDGAQQDIYGAYVWYSLAAINGSTSAVESRDTLAADLSPDQIAAGKAKAAEFAR